MQYFVRPSLRFESLRRAVLHQAVAALLLSGGADAQRFVPSLDVGGSTLRQADSVTSSAVTLTPALRLEWDRATLGGSLGVSQYDAGTNVQGAAGGSAFMPLASRIFAEVAGTFAASAGSGVSTSQALALVRAHVMGARRGAWGGAGAGTAHDGFTTRAVRIAEAGAWAYIGPSAVLGTLVPSRVGAFRYTDGEAAFRWLGDRAEVGLIAGARFAASRADSLSTSWAQASGALWIARGVALVASGGAYPADVGTGSAGGRFMSLALRLGPRPTRRPADDLSSTSRSRTSVLESNPQAVKRGLLGFRVQAAPAGRQMLHVHAPRARRVEVTGDFTMWTPVALTRGERGWWTVSLPIDPGAHEMNVRLDGGAWLVPPGLPAVGDEFGGTAGILAIP